MSRTIKDKPYRFRTDLPREEWHDKRCPHYDGNGRFQYRARKYHSEVVVLGTERKRVRMLKMTDSKGGTFGAEIVDHLINGKRQRYFRLDVTEPVRLVTIEDQYVVKYDVIAHPNAVPVAFEYDQWNGPLDEDGNPTLKHGRYLRTYDKWIEREVTERVSYYTYDDTEFECDIDSKDRRSNCEYWPDYPYHYSPPREMRRLDYYKPERNYVRSTLKRAMDEYNAWGDTDEQPDDRQHRHTPWNGGWWD